MSQTLLPHLSLPLYFQPTCQLHCYLMASLVEAEMGERRKTDLEPSIQGPNLYLRKQNKNLVSAPFQNEWKSFPLWSNKKRASAVEVRQKLKKSLWRLESSTLPCVSFRALECLNQCRRQLEAVGDELQGGSLQSLSGSLWTDLFIWRKVMNSTKS